MNFVLNDDDEILFRFQCFLSKFGKFRIEFADAIARVRAQCHLNLVVHVEPFGMMVVLLGKQCQPGHETERLFFVFQIKILFLKRRINFIYYLLD